MRRTKVRDLTAGLGCCLALHAGCAGLSSVKPVDSAPPVVHARPVPLAQLSVIQQASFVTAGPTEPAPPAALPAHPFAGVNELSVEVVVQQVVARNPTLAQMAAAWHAAQARYPQVTSLDDPMAGAYFGPASIGSRDVDFAYRLEISQKFPLGCKLALRGENALAEASAAGHDVEDTRLQLIESARAAFFDYFLAVRALAVNEEGLKLLREFRQNAETRYRTGLVPQQDLLQADVEIGRTRDRQLMLERLHRVAIARINTLMHLPPDAPLPPPPAEVRLGGPLPPAEMLRASALAHRPDLKALADRVAADEAALALAKKEFYPDVELMAAYDAFWQPPEEDLRTQLGARINLPVRKARRCGAIAEAEARIAQRRAQLDRLADQVNYDVQQAFEQVRESERSVRLYEETILPTARENVKAARAAYITGRIPFLSLLEAQRNEVGLRDRFYEALADYHRRLATLERVTGGPLVPALETLPTPTAVPATGTP